MESLECHMHILATCVLQELRNATYGLVLYAI